MTVPAYYSIADVCDLLAISRSTVKRRLSEGVWTRVKVGGAVRIPRAEVDALMPRPKRRRAA